MRRYLLDTGAAADWIARQGPTLARFRAALASGDRIGICPPVLGELWAGVEGSQTRDRNRQRLIGFLNEVVVWPYDNDAAEEYGRVFADLRRRGRPIQQVDIQIAAVLRRKGAIRLRNCIVVTKDSDFLAIPDLKVEDWSKPL
jgi:tRNA(fMet)-specific endonuclease VapC